MSIRTDSTMFAALHGKLALHPWRDPVAAESDAYSLFVARSSAMGWLADAAEHGVGGVWGMNDAEQDSVSGAQPTHRVWFQVSLSDPIPAGRPLPVQAFLVCAGDVHQGFDLALRIQAFLVCAGDVVARMGTLRLQAVQVLLPVQSLNPSVDASSHMDAVMTLLQNTGWFADGDPHLRTPVRVTVDGGQNSSIRAAAPGILQWIQDIKQDVFVCDSFSLADEDAVFLKPDVTDQLWLGPAQHRVTFRGTLAEWSVDSLGWLVAFLANASSQHGVSTPLMLTIVRPEGSVSHVD